MIFLPSNYPVVLNIKGKKAVVIGGGQVAERKIFKLKESGARVTVISPEVTEKIKRLASDRTIYWSKKCFEPKDIYHAFIIIAATNNKEVNLQVYKTTNKSQLINIVDDPIRSNFIVPSTVHRGKLIISVSTSGASPGLSKKIINQLKEHYDDTYEDYVDFLFNCRMQIQQELNDELARREILKALLNNEFLEMTKKGQFALREKRFLELWKGRRDYEKR